MFRIAILSFLAQLCVSNAVQYQIECSTIDSVLLYPTQAEIQRSFDIREHIPAGYHELHLMNLVDNFDESSLHILGSGNMAILDTSFHEYDSSSTQERADVLQLKLTHLQEKKWAVDQEHSHVSTRMHSVKQYIDSLFSKPAGGAGSITSMPMDKLKEVLDFQDRILLDSTKELSALLMQQNNVNSEIKTISDELGSLEYPSATQGSARSKKLVMRVHVSSAVGVSAGSKVSLSYHCSGRGHRASSWTPEYDVRVQAGTKGAGAEPTGYGLTLDYYASVQQSTGEPWSEVRLALSSTDPAPSLKRAPASERVGVYFVSEHFYDQVGGMAPRSRTNNNKARAKLAHAPMMMRASSNTADDIQESSPVMEMDFMMPVTQVVTQSDLGASFIFQLNHPTSINSTDQATLGRPSVGPRGGTVGATAPTAAAPHRIFIQSVHVEASVFSFAVPSADSDAFLLSHTPHFIDTGHGSEGENPQPVPLLASHKSRVFIEDSFIGSTSLPAVQPSGELTLNLGVDKRLKVVATRVLAKRSKEEEDKSTWFVSDKKKFRVKTEELLFTLTSSHVNTQLVLVSEALPASSEEDIKIELISPAPPAATTGGKSLLEKEVRLLEREAGVDKIIGGDRGGGGVVGGRAKLIPRVVASSKEGCIRHILALAETAKPPEGSSSSGGSTSTLSYVCEGQSSVFWARWMRPREVAQVSYSYRTVWPDGKEIHLQ